MLTKPAVHEARATVAELREYFEDEHVHMALLVENGKLVAAVERADLAAADRYDAPAGDLATLEGRTIAPDAELAQALEEMRRAGRRRLAVTDGGALLGLLCLKASRDGFCSDADVRSRAIGG
jgi:CBS domain-containing protein